MRRRNRRESEDNPDRWVVSYADFVTLLFAFFVVMYAISSLDVRKWERVSVGMKSAFVNPLAGVNPVLAEIRRQGGALGQRQGRGDGDREGTGSSAWELLLLRDHLESILEEARLSGDEESDPIRISLSDRGLVISLSASQFFEGGSARLSPQARPVLDQIAELLATSGAALRVEGHTDDRPSSNPGFESNWELSSARAGAVARSLIEEHRISAERVAIAGFAAHRPVASNHTAEGRALNRRVNVVVLHAPEASGSDAPDGEGDALNDLLQQLEPLATE